MFNYDKTKPSTIFGYIGFNNYGDELLAKTLIEKYQLESYKFLSRKNSLFSHLSQLLSSKQVFALGGLFQDQTSYFSLFYYCLLLRIFQILGKKVYLVSVGVGPVDTEVGLFTLFNCLKSVQNISVRDEYSKKLLASINIDSELERDLAWHNKEILSKAKSNNKTLICVRNINDWILVKERFEFGDFDLLVMQKEFELTEQIKLETSIGVNVIDPFAYEFEELLYTISAYDKLISSRYHAAILGFLAKIDVKILEISPKLSSLLNTIAEA